MAGKKVYPVELSAEQVSQISNTYNDFRTKFGEEDARQVLTAGAHSRERARKSDYFVDCLAVAIAYDCFTEFSESHRFSSTADEYFAWISGMISSNVFTFKEYQNQKNSVLDSHKKKFTKFV